MIFFLPTSRYISISAGQEVVIRPQKAIQHEVAVSLKLIQVYVADKKGQPVSDLKIEDFIITDNGQPVTLTDFERHVISPPATAAAALTKPEDKPPGVVPPLAAAKPGEAAAAAPGASPSIARKFVFFIDLAYNNARGVKKAKDVALRFLEKDIKPGDEAALFSYSLTRGMAINEFLTADHAKVRRAVEALDVKEAAGRAEDVEQQYWRIVTEENPEPTDLYDAVSRRKDAKSQALLYIDRITALAKGLRYVPGQKHVFLFSTGIAYSMLYGGQAGTPQGSSGVADRSAVEYPDFRLRTRYEEMQRELGSSNCSVYSFDTRETALQVNLFDYDERTFGSRNSRDLFTQGGVQQNVDLALKRETNTGLGTLTKLSSTTGGQYFGNINEFERNLEQVQVLTGTYYVLGYPISQSWDGKYHEVKVQVKRKGCEVRAQAGYFNPVPFAQYGPLEKELHLLDLALSDNPVFQAPAVLDMVALAGAAASPGTAASSPGEAAGSGAGAPSLVLLAKLPPDAVDRFAAEKAEILTFVFDDKDNLASLHRTEESFSRFKERTVFYVSGAALPAGAYKCRLVIRGLESGTAAVAKAQAFVSAPPAAGIRLHPPLLLVPAAEAAFLEARPRRAGGTAAPGSDPARLTSLYPFDGRTRAPLLGSIPKGTLAVEAVLPLSVRDIAAPRIAVRASLLDSATGMKTPLRVEPIGRLARDGGYVQTIRLDTADLPPGRYILYFHAEEESTKALGYTSVSLAVR